MSTLQPGQGVHLAPQVSAPATIPQMIMLGNLYVISMILGTRNRFRRAVVIIVLVIILVIVVRLPLPAEFPALPPEYFPTV